MFELTLITARGERAYPPFVESFTLKQSCDTPADSFSATMRDVDWAHEYAEVELRVAGELVFCGIVDDERHSVTKDGRGLMIVARSFAGVLLDNEACPQTFYQMTLHELQQYYLEPCRITNIVCTRPMCVPTMVVRKGMSVYELCETVAVLAALEQPRVTGRDTIDFTGGEGLAPVVFSNTQAGATMAADVTKEVRRCEVISDVIIRSPEDGRYRTAVVNRYAWDEYLRRTRYYHPPSEWAIMPNLGANEMIRDSMLRRFAVRLTTPALTIHPLFSKASVEVDGVRMDGLFIAEKRMVLDGGGLRTEYVLRDDRYRSIIVPTDMELHHL